MVWNKEYGNKWGWPWNLTERVWGRILVAGGKESNQELGVGRRRMAPEAWEEKGRGTGLKTSRAGKNR